VVVHLHEVKSGLLGQHGLPDELGGTESLGGQHLANLHRRLLSRAITGAATRLLLRNAGP
jgi:hypothetical protein